MWTVFLTEFVHAWLLLRLGQGKLLERFDSWLSDCPTSSFHLKLELKPEFELDAGENAFEPDAFSKAFAIHSRNMIEQLFNVVSENVSFTLRTYHRFLRHTQFRTT